MIVNKESSQNFISQRKNDTENKIFNVKFCSLFNKLLKTNNQNHPEFTVFSLHRDPFISFENYLKRLISHTKPDISTLILTLIYIDRIQISDFFISDVNVHRLFLAGLITALKFNEDEIYTNKYYAMLGGINSKDLSKLEIEFLRLIKFQLYVDETLYNLYEKSLSEYYERSI